MKKSLLSIFLVVFVLAANSLRAQLPVNYVFSQDSLAGFDVADANARALANNCFGKEYKSYLYRAKREYINHKFNLEHSDNIVWKTSQPAQTMTVQPSCSNVDFEAGTFAGWTLMNGSNTNSSTMAGCCPNATGNVSQIVNSTGNDPVAGALLPLASPFGGTKIAKINDDIYDYSVERITQSFNVTSSNAIFQFAYAGILQAGGHVCTEQPYMNVAVIDSAGNVLACPKIVIVAPSASCTQPASVTAGWTALGGSAYYHTWDIRTIDLSPYIGTAVTIQITVGDCTNGGHYGYGYFDCRCLPLEISLNGTIYDATPQTPINVSTCGSTSGLIFAPTGLNPYTWDGPPASGITGVTTQSISTTTPGTYTLNMNPSGGCMPGGVTKFIILNVTPNPTVTNVTAQATCTNATGSGTISVSSGSAPFTYNWLPAASTGSIGTGLSPGTDYTVNVVDTFGCQSATTVSIASFTDAPTYTISPLSANLTCLSTSVTVTATTFSNTTAVWTHTSTSSFDATTAGTYSCVVTNTISSCTSTVPITITSNTVAPVASYTMLCNGSTVSLNASSSGGVALGWLAPTLPSPSPISNPGSSTATGIYTLTATNLGTGCQTTYTMVSAVPTLSLLTSPSNQLTCINDTISSIASSSTPSANISWYDGVTNSPLDTIIIMTAGSYTAMVNLPGGCSTQSVITITTNTNVGANITSPTTVLSCITTSITLTANQTSGGVYNYTWTPSTPTATNSTYQIGTIGTYSLNMINTTNGCTATAVPYTITSNVILPTATYSVLCGTFPATLSATSTFSAPVTINWITPTTPTVTAANNSTSTASGIFTVVVTNPATGCVNSYTYPSYVPELTMLTSPANNSITCTNPTITASGTSTTSGAAITWNNGSTITTGSNYPITTPGTYTVNAQVGTGCITQSVVTITTNTISNVSISTPSTIVSCATNSLPLTAVTSGIYTYTWTSPVPPVTNAQVHNASTPGTYTVIVTNSINGCTATATQAVTHETVTASFDVDTDQGLMPLPVTFTNTSVNAANYYWDLGNGMTYTNTNVSTVYNEQGHYTVILIATNGFCADTATRIIKVDIVSTFRVPNVFTPNGDGKNDIFTIDAANMGDISITIFDRWGLKMFETTSTGNIKWDGKNKGGSLVNDGTYFYIIKATGLDDVKYDLQGTINVFSN